MLALIYKPHLRPFREALRASMLKPQETAFVGDSAVSDIGPAKRIGMRAWVFDSKNGDGGATSKLKELLELFEVMIKLLYGNTLSHVLYPKC